MISVGTVWRWATASNEQALANARAAATECSRLRVERAEVDQFLAGLTQSTAEATTKAAAAGR